MDKEFGTDTYRVYTHLRRKAKEKFLAEHG